MAVLLLGTPARASAALASLPGTYRVLAVAWAPAHALVVCIAGGSGIALGSSAGRLDGSATGIVWPLGAGVLTLVCALWRTPEGRAGLAVTVVAAQLPLTARADAVGPLLPGALVAAAFLVGHASGARRRLASAGT